MSHPEPLLPLPAPFTTEIQGEQAGAQVPAFWPQNAAVALVYAGDDLAPRVAAKGRGLVAQAIIEQARQHGVHVHESKELVALLMQVDLDQRIPAQLYRAVAELLAWVYRLEHGPLLPPVLPPADGGDNAPMPLRP